MPLDNQITKSPNHQIQATWESFVVVAIVARPQGRRGEVIAASLTDFGEERFKPGNTVQVKRGDAIETLTVISSREHDGRWVLGFEGIGSIDEAETLRGLELRVPEATLQPLAPGTFYVHDLVGCRVDTIAGAAVGIVKRVEFGAGGAALVVADATGEVMVPLVDAICRSVDVAAKTVVIEPPEGLLDLRLQTDN
jgi:16S rRNA processing protein RimM